MANKVLIRDDCNANRGPDELQFTNPVITPAALNASPSTGMMSVDSDDSNTFKVNLSVERDFVPLLHSL